MDRRSEYRRALQIVTIRFRCNILRKPPCAAPMLSK